MCLINDILDCSKIETGKVDIEIIECSLESMLNDIYTLMWPQAEEKNIDFAIHYVSKLPETIRTDPTRLRQCLINLIGNAIKFTEQGHVFVDVGWDISPYQSCLHFDVK